MWNAVDCIEETEKSDSAHWTTESLSERTHEFEKPLLLLSFLFLVAFQPALSLLKCSASFVRSKA